MSGLIKLSELSSSMISDSWIKIFYSGAFVTGAGPRRGQVAPGRTRAGPGPDSGRARAGIQIIVKADGQALSGGWTSPQRSYAADARDVPVTVSRRRCRADATVTVTVTVTPWLPHHRTEPGA
jgi:hypothetical protein